MQARGQEAWAREGRGQEGGPVEQVNAWGEEARARLGRELVVQVQAREQEAWAREGRGQEGGPVEQVNAWGEEAQIGRAHV